jgi:transcriptional regulator of acetoin/glycerol metabolism
VQELSTDDFDLPWKRRVGAAAASVPHLVIAWSLEEPERVEDDFVAATPELRAELGSPETESEIEPDRGAIEAALQTARGNITRATRLLGLRNRYVLYRLMRKQGIPTRE